MGFVCGLTYALVGCGGRYQSPDQAFRQIQLHEAALARALATLERARCGDRGERPIGGERGEGGERGDAAVDSERTACEASESLCALSAELDDRDATQRCLRARDGCTAAREHVRVGCATPAP